MEELLSQLQTLVKGVSKYRWYAMAIAWIVTLVGSIVIFTLPDTYQSSARVFVDTQSVLKPLLSGMTSVPNVEQQVSIMSRTLLSRPNIERVIRMVDLDIKTGTAKDKEKLIDELISRIKINGTIQNDIYTISYTGDSPRLTKDVVQSLLTIFVEGSFGGKKNDSAKAIQFIDDQIKTYEEKLASAENALKDFKLKHMGLLPRQGSDYGSKLLEMSDQLNQARLELREAEQARDAIKRQISGDEAGAVSATPIVVNPEIDERIQAQYKNLDTLRMQYTEQHPDIVSTKRLIAQLEARKAEEAKVKKTGGDPGAHYSPMLQQLKVSLSSAEARVASMRARVDEFSMRVARLKEMSLAAPEVETQLAQLNRDYQINKENYEKLVASREAAKLSGELSATTEMMTFRVVDPPTMPLRPTGPKRALLFAGLLAGALAAGIAVAFLLSKVRPTFLSQNELRNETGLPILGTVTMIWTDQEKQRRKKRLYAFGASFATLVVLYGGLIGAMLLKA
ncbi:polysaccharide chain length determinant protein (PEP-CTERM system associated) [Paucimonas lemoignei]|uniref:Polysaccharide chain length determinant protein (PEP-CTERM system associated) n=1 Tax=Paucimonas lemoignei TaxID=29443 RepID=A0A4R3I078_PAULE|nr:XrtA system polysaccharide chain length determinant [Paucimonas lemoignei]TCS38574.1 polysaccharide chain length determinant protein (PEP-CTERM system associated) [Paucimonas lemoignei]